jgi:uncharacterized protein (TIGR02246 family)
MSRLISLILVIMLTACSQQQTGKQKVDLDAEEQAIRSISMEYLGFVKNNDAVSTAALFADDGISYTESVEPSVGPAAVEEAFRKSMEKNPEFVVDWTTDRVEVAASGDLAVEYGSYKMSFPGPEGPQEDFGKYITVYRKVNDVWKIAADMATSTKPEESSE